MATGYSVLTRGSLSLSTEGQTRSLQMTKIKKIAAGALLAGALSAGVVAGSGTAGADPWHPWPPIPNPPGPGVLPPPGHLQKLPGVPPPGHWPVNPGWVNHW